ncbi:MAG: EAL domain-containing protein [Desulfobacteraceae bacterium]|nr:EAL domain-containing protein [Desulfobacteraceae bacterium]
MNTEAAILVVEDVKSTRFALVRILNKLGFEFIYEAENGREALDRLKRTRADLVLLDVLMPEIDGHEVLKTMKADVNLRHIPVIMVTSVDDMESAVTCIERGAEDYLTKPFNPVMLRARIFSSLEKKRLQDIEKEYLSMYDSATGLPNHHYFLRRLSEQINRSDRLPSLFAVISVQMRKYPIIFETLGRRTANEYLVKRARQLRNTLAEDTLLARTGEQTFAVLLFDLPSLTKGNAAAISIYETLSTPLNLAGHEIAGRVNVGMVYNKPPYTNAEIMFRDAGLAARRAGTRGGFKIFDDTLHQEAMRRLALEPDLRRALNNYQFLMHYQPIVRLKNGDVAGYEALVRWRHPEKGIIMPEQFIPIAEDTGAIIPLGNWVIYEVCRQAAEWEKTAGKNNNFTISVNVSAYQFADPEFLTVLQGALEKTGAGSSHINLELTETALIENTDRLAEILNELTRINVRTSLDDFGKGYCSLNYLNHFPFDTLKIDKSLINQIHRTPRNQAIVGSTIELAHRLGMSVVAEGLENRQDVATLQEMDCEYGQGWFYDEPLPMEQAGKLLF